MALKSNRDKVLEVLKNRVPKKEFGIRSAYWKPVGKGDLDFLFVVDEEKAAMATAYIRSLFNSVEQSLGNIDVEITIHIYEKQKATRIRTYAKQHDFKTAELAPCFV